MFPSSPTRRLFRSLLRSSVVFGVRAESNGSGFVGRVRLFERWQQNDAALEAEFEHSRAVLMIDKQPVVSSDDSSMRLVHFETADLRSRLSDFGLEIHPAINSCLLDLAPPTVEHGDLIDIRQLRRNLAASLGGRFQNLRLAMLTLPVEEDRLLLAKFQALTRWYHVFRRCPTCTAPLRVRVSKCGARCIRCERDFYPTLSPVAICLVHDLQNEHCLLVRHRSSVPNVYTNVAGFASLGESLEQTVRREVAEEVGIELLDVRATNLSQPWPFPQSSLMCGYTATADPEQPFDVCPNELETARWFPKAEVRAALERTEGDPLFKQFTRSRLKKQDDNEEVDADAFLYLPPHGAIAHQLIKRWIKES
ncbi:NAD-capped RNA hydrolase ndx-9 [Aphelenchoides fujianensis]|nr:NAD-capped RNA hydrolase ndx-9 [Aphelenchoides fujianensis]